LTALNEIFPVVPEKHFNPKAKFEVLYGRCAGAEKQSTARSVFIHRSKKFSAFVLVRVNHVASRIVHTNHGIM
jgi:hypothetical protein